MRRVTLRAIWEHKRRLVSTVLAIVLGVAFMSGTLVFADTIDKVFDDLFADVNEDIDVRVQGVTLFTGSFGGPDARELLEPSLVETISEVEGVVRAEPFVQTMGFGTNNRVLDPEDEPLGAITGPPTLLESWIDDDVLSPYRLHEGRAPQSDDEIAVNVAAAEDADLHLGDELTVVSQFGESTYTLVGTFTFGEAESAAGAVSADFTLDEAQRLAGTGGRVHSIVVGGAEGVDQEQLAERISRVLPTTAEALTGAEASEQNASAAQEGFAFFRQVLVIFAAIALLVGTFIITNTFAILVAQRTRELALLRAIGASRRQVLGSVVLEATVIGLVAAVLGLLGGVALALAVTAGLEAAGGDLPTSGLVISRTTVVVALVAGLGVTVLASILPAVQATRVPPLAALREVAVDRSSASRVRIALGVVMLLGGGFALSAAWRSGDTDSLPSVGIGALLVIVGAIVIGPALAEPTVRMLGAGLPRLKGITGVLARENAARSPKRTSATASALLIGVALIGFITIFGASARASVVSEVERGFTGDLIVQADAGFGPPTGFSPTIAEEIATLPGVESVSSVGFAQAQIAHPDGDISTTFLTTVDPDSLEQVLEPRMASGDIGALRPDGIVVDVGLAEDEGLATGDRVQVTGPSGEQVELDIQAVSDDPTLLGFWAVHNAIRDRILAERLDVQVIISVADGADVGDVEAAISEIVDDVPSLSVLDRDAFVGDLTSQITGFLTFINALLLLSVVIAMIGIANTLSLSIHERTRELGLLRAVGMSRSQLRSAVRWEAVIISVLGTVVGLAIGLVVSWALVTALEGSGLSRFSVPVPMLVFVVVAAAVLGVLTSIRPARRAARLDVLDAIATE